MKSEAELLLFTASRAQLTREVIAPALQAGITVLADRFMDSTTVYQGVARAIPEESVRLINNFAVGDTKPDITFVLDLDLRLAKERMSQRAKPAGGGDRMEQQPDSFYEAVRRGYLDLASREPERVRLIDASQSIDVIEAQIWSHIEPHLAIPTPR